jgi:hypothetical protein
MTKRTKIFLILDTFLFAASIATIVFVYTNIHKKEAEENNEFCAIVVPSQGEFYDNIIETEDNFIYNKTEVPSYTYMEITGIKEGTDTLEIPKDYQGAPVVEIGMGAFRYNQDIKKVVVSMPIAISFNAFESSSITELRIEDSTGKKSDYSYGFSANCFRDCKELQSVYCDAIMGDIEASSFEGCTSLKKVEFYYPFDSINANAFRDCNMLEEIVLPATVSNIDDTASEGCTSLKTIKGYNGSFVESWAKEHGYTWVGEDA